MMPRMRFPRNDWDNQCSITKEDVDSAEDCKDACIEETSCMQYMFDPNLQQCKISHDAIFGEASEGSGLFSEWLFDRIEQWRDDQPPCDDESFLYDVVETEVDL